ncbi:hypothetical protein KI387_022875 [Taxus chinensis]|uniref:DUF7804 domain-containing protein n=1 Tax=Taxus chinensis TaxID=29808 RepID=A0AA38G2S0_TAXCH|nr:hypothetical protein KI387_022875 [Taxus chinensis]
MATQSLRSGGRAGIGINIGNTLFCNSFSSKPIRMPISQISFKNKENYRMKPLSVLSTIASGSRLQNEMAIKNEDGVMSSSDSTRCTYQNKLEEWVHDSLIEIVKHIQEAPFLHYVYDKKSHSVKIQRQRVLEDMFGSPISWDGIRNSLRDVCPDAMIFVQRLDGDSKCRHCNVSCTDGQDYVYSSGMERQVLDEQGRTHLWGLLVQGRGVGVHACYILKTTQVVSHVGFCTHFSLIRAKCFGPSPDTQLEDSWRI